MHNKLIELGKKSNLDIEINEIRNEKTEISYFNKDLKEFKISDIKTYTVKALREGKKASIITENLNNPEDIINELENILNICDNNNPSLLNKTNKHIKEVNENIDTAKIKKDLLSINDFKEKYPNIKDISITYCHYKDSTNISNVKTNLSDNYYFNEYSASITISEKEENKVAFVLHYSRNYDFQAFKKVFEEKIKNIEMKLNSTSCKTAKYNIILKNNAVANLLSYFSDIFYARNIFLKKSILTDKLNTKVFSDKLNIIEDSTNKNSIIEIHFDSEGTEKKKNIVIENGIFKKELNDLEYALKNNTDPTGDSDGVNNLYIESGDINYEKMINKLENGIIIDEIYGLHAGIDYSTGNISLQSEGYMVENGKITNGLNMIILSTNIFELFNNIKYIGNDISTNRCDTRSPSLLIENITIAGKK